MNASGRRKSGNAGRARRVGELLLACLREGEPEAKAVRIRALASRVDPRDIVPAARYHRVVSPVYQSLRAVDAVERETLTALGSLSRAVMLATLRVKASLTTVRSALDGEVAPWLVLKGPVLAETAYRGSGLRLYSDLDVLVGRRDFRSALEALERCGLELLDRNWRLIRGRRGAELKFAVPGAASVDLHWHLLYEHENRAAFAIPVEEMIDRARTIIVAGDATLTFDAVDTLIHVAVHACREGGDRLLWLRDLERLAVNDPPDWGAVAERARAARVHLLVGTMLSRARRLLAAPVPDDILDDLIPNTGWRTLVMSIDRLSPVHTSTGGPMLSRALAAKSRGSVRASAQELASAALEGVRQRQRWRNRGAPWVRDTWREDPHNEESLLHEHGGADDRERFLAEITEDAVDDEREIQTI